MKKLGPEFYQRKDVVTIARELLGKILVTNFDNTVTSGRIIETEAYNGILDKASHAYGGRRTNRTETMYRDGGTAYVYLCYGIHHLFNVVTNSINEPEAVLIRGIKPLLGLPTMLHRTGKTMAKPNFGTGPGVVSKALGITTSHTGQSLLDEDSIWVADDGFRPDPESIIATPRIGVDYAGEDALLPYRFLIVL